MIEEKHSVNGFRSISGRKEREREVTRMLDIKMSEK